MPTRKRLKDDAQGLGMLVGMGIAVVPLSVVGGILGAAQAVLKRVRKLAASPSPPPTVLPSPRQTAASRYHRRRQP